MLKFVVSSDWHLDAVTAGVERFEEIAGAVEQTVATEVLLDAQAYLFLGDLADPSPPARSHRAAEKAATTAARIKQLGLDSFWLPGNHDVTEDGNGTTTLDAVAGAGRVLKKPSLTIYGEAALLALPFTPRSHAYDPGQAVNDLTKDLPRGTPVLVLSHLNIEGFTPGSEATDLPRGREVLLPKAEIDALRKRGHAVQVLNGHYHRWSDNTADQIAVVGSLARLTFGEERNEPQFLVVGLRESGKGKKRQYEWMIEHRSLKEVAVLRTLTPGDEGFTASELVGVKGEIVRVSPPASFSQDLSACEEDLRRAGALGVKVLPLPPKTAVVKPDEEAATDPERRSHRLVIEQMVAEARSRDREALAALCGLVMDEEEIDTKEADRCM